MLLPTFPPSPSTPSSQIPPQTLALALSQLPAQTLLEHASLVHGLWENTVDLKISDDRLWDTIGLAWSILLGAMFEHQRAAEAEEARQWAAAEA